MKFLQCVCHTPLRKNHNKEGRAQVEVSLQEKEGKDAKNAEDVAVKQVVFIKRKALRAL